MSANFAARNSMAQQLVTSNAFHPVLGLAVAAACVTLAAPADVVGLSARLLVLAILAVLVSSLVVVRRLTLRGATTNPTRGTSAYLVPGYLGGIAVVLAGAAFAPTPKLTDAVFFGGMALAFIIMVGRMYDADRADED